MDVDIPLLERLAAQGWPAVERATLGDWLLRASAGFTSRGNSVLPVGDPGLPLPLAIGEVERWYAARGLPARFTVIDGLPEAEALAEALVGRGYLPHSPTVALVAEPAWWPPDQAAEPPVTAEPAPSPAWLGAFAAYRPVVADAALTVLTGSAQQWFLRTTEGKRITGIGRVSLDQGWAGVHAMWVDPQQRRQGLGTALLRSASRIARDADAVGTYLLVEVDNRPACELYASCGFTVHHGYHYLLAPSPGPHRP